jgi:hypothetical protein
MSLKNPVAVYTAASNLEAHLICNVLNDAGLEAYCLEDGNMAGFSMLGAMPEIHRPQVWVEQEDVERAQPVLLDYEMRQAERRAAEAATSLPIRIVCEECGQQNLFDYELHGSVQTCVHCGAYVDVTLTSEPPEGFASEDIQEGESEE